MKSILLMFRKNYHFTRFLILCIFLVFSNCHRSLYITEKRPATFPLEGIRSLAICDISADNTAWDNNAISLRNSLYSAFRRNGFYNVRNISDLSAFISPKDILIYPQPIDLYATIGRSLGTDAVLIGRIVNIQVSDNGKWTTVKRYDRKEKKNIETLVFKVTRTVRIVLTVMIIDVRSSSLIFKNTFSKSTSSTRRNTEQKIAISQLPDSDNTIRFLNTIMVNEILEIFSPHIKLVRAELMKNRNKQMRTAQDHAVKGKWEDAMSIWDEIVRTGNLKEKRSAFFNIAVFYQSMHDYENALKYIEKALDLGENRMVERKRTELLIKKDQHKIAIQQMQEK